MNKDEMIKNMAELIECEHTKCDEILDCTKCKYRPIDNCVSYMAGVALYNAGYCKVGADAIVMSKEAYYEALNAAQESGQRMGYAQGREKTAREIFADYKTFRYLDRTEYEFKGWLCRKYGIDEED